MKEAPPLNKTTKTKRVFPRISADWHEKLSIIAEKRGQNLSALTRQLYRDLIMKEFPASLNQKPVR
jgi:hypothetical protein